MKKQYAKGYNPIGISGCYFACLGKIAEEIAGKELTDIQVNRVYATAIIGSDMDTNCFVRKPGDVGTLFLEELDSPKKLIFIGYWNKDTGANFEKGFSSEMIDFDVQRVATGKVQYPHHFRLPGWNPYPELPQTDDITGHRYFKVV